MSITKCISFASFPLSVAICLSLSSVVYAAPDCAADLNPVAAKARAANEFGLKLLREAMLADTAKGGGLANTMVSPLSAFAAFSMLYGGTQGDIRDLLGPILGVGRDESLVQFDDLNQQFRVGLHQEPTTAPAGRNQDLPTLGIYNSAWATNGRSLGTRFEFSDAFTRRLEQFYAAEETSLDFAASESSDRLNNWAHDKTRGLISNIIDQPTLANLAWLLINATFLEAKWSSSLDDFPVGRAPAFNYLNGSQKQVPMVGGDGYYSFIEKPEYRAVELPFAGGDLSFVVVEPRDYHQWAQSGSFLQEDTWETIFRGLNADSARSEKVKFKMPKFNFAYSVTLKRGESLTERLGLAPLFDPRSAQDFSPLGHSVPGIEGTVVGMVKQDTKIELDKNGVKAAAVTMIGGVFTTSIPQPATRKIEIDKPFAFAIKSRSTGAILFVGGVTEP